MKPNASPIKYARIYGRYSSKGQQDNDSVRRQVDGANAYAKRNGIEIIGQPYFDEGVSGKAGANLRKELGRAIADTQRGEIIIVELQDRLGRQNPFELMHLLYQLVTEKGAAIHVWSENMIIDQTTVNEFGSQLKMFVGAAIGHQENVRKIGRIIETVEETMKSCANGHLVKGALRFTPQCFKWDTKHNRVYVDDKQANVVKKIFSMYNDGQGTTRIAKHLNETKEPTFYRIENGKDKKGNKKKPAMWHGNTVKYILTCPCYNKVLEINGERYNILDEVVSDEVFAKTQMLLARNKTNKGKLNGRTNNIFGQVVFCKHCGGRIKSAKAGKYSYMYCCKNSLEGGCKNKDGGTNKNVMLNARYVEYGFFKLVFGDRAHGLMRGDDRNLMLKEQIEGLKSQIADLDSRIENLWDDKERGDKEASRRIAIRRAEKDNAENQIRILKAQLTEDGQFDSNVNVIYNMVTLEDIWFSKKKMVPIFDILNDDEKRKRISMIMPTLFSKITFDCAANKVEVFNKDGSLKVSFSPKAFEKELARKRKQTSITSFEPPPRTFKPRKITGKA
ncbi:MAG: recombinase family protein [Verrucomicrobiae bacterium]|nr:recombinase family protein [Verrucomicrobiae bacterium]